MTQASRPEPRASAGVPNHRHDTTLKPVVSLPWWPGSRIFILFERGDLQLASELWNGQRQQMECHDTGTKKRNVRKAVVTHAELCAV